MSLISKKNLLERIRRGREARTQLVESNLSQGIAYQIRATRDSQHLNQGQLAQAVGMTPNNLCRLENPDYGKHTISSLKRIADALDVALVVRFVPFSQYIAWLSGSSYLDSGISPESMAPPSFAREEERGVFDLSLKDVSLDRLMSVQREGGRGGEMAQLIPNPDESSRMSEPIYKNAAGPAPTEVNPVIARLVSASKTRFVERQLRKAPIQRRGMRRMKGHARRKFAVQRREAA